MKTVYLVRHGESHVNVSETFVDEELGLTESGIVQAKAIAERAMRLPLQLLVTSSMTRTRETASYIAEATGLEIMPSDLFIERRVPKAVYGHEKASAHAIAVMRAWQDSFFGRGPRYETEDDFDSLYARAGEAMRFLEARAEEHIMVVTHGFFLRMLLGRVLFGEALTPREFFHLMAGTTAGHTGITVLQYNITKPHEADPDVLRWKIATLNDIAHLG